MYIQQPKGMYSACWGGLMSTRAQKLGSLGTMIDGRMRDTAEHVEMGYPVSLYYGIAMVISFRVCLISGIISCLDTSTNPRAIRSLLEIRRSLDQTHSPAPRRLIFRCSSRAIFGSIQVIFSLVMRMGPWWFRRPCWSRWLSCARSGLRLMGRPCRLCGRVSLWVVLSSDCVSRICIIIWYN